VILVGIPRQEHFSLSASTMRRKGLTLKMARRMKHTYPRTIELVSRGRVDLAPLITHRFTLDEAPRAFALQAGRGEGVLRAVVEPCR